MEKLLTVEEFCEAARISDRTFRSLGKRGDLPPRSKIGRRYVMRPEAVQEWLLSREEQAQAA